MALTLRISILLVGVALASTGCDNGQPAQDAAPEAAPSAAQTAAPQPCDRQCLLGMVDSYLAALVAHDPAQAPFAADAKFTENAQRLALGDALWGTAGAGPEGYKLVVADPAKGQAGFYILMKEHDDPIWLSGRLKVENRLITELETVIIRKGVGFGEFERTAYDPVWDEILTADQRRPHDELISIANRYLEALDSDLTDYVPFTDDCNRIENGVQTANDPDAPATDNGPRLRALSCRDNINSMMWVYITDIDPRRFLVVDEERGIVFGVFMFHHDGTHESTTIPGYGEFKYSGPTRRPFTTVIPEMFKIVDGKIRQIEATMTALPFGSKSGWD